MEWDWFPGLPYASEINRFSEPILASVGARGINAQRPRDGFETRTASGINAPLHAAEWRWRGKCKIPTQFSASLVQRSAVWQSRGAINHSPPKVGSVVSHAPPCFIVPTPAHAPDHAKPDPFGQGPLPILARLPERMLSKPFSPNNPPAGHPGPPPQPTLTTTTTLIGIAVSLGVLF